MRKYFVYVYFEDREKRTIRRTSFYFISMDLNWLAKIKGLRSFHRVEIDECTRDSMTYIFLFSSFFLRGEMHTTFFWEFTFFQRNRIRLEFGIKYVLKIPAFNDRSFVVDKEVVIFEIIGEFKVFLNFNSLIFDRSKENFKVNYRDNFLILNNCSSHLQFIRCVEKEQRTKKLFP